MLKAEALQQLGGSVTTAARAIGISPSAVSQWPDVLPRRIEDRVLAAVARQQAARAQSVVEPQPAEVRDAAPGERAAA